MKRKATTSKIGKPRLKKKASSENGTLSVQGELLHIAAQAGEMITCIWDFQKDEIRWGPNGSRIFGRRSHLPKTAVEWENAIHPEDRKQACSAWKRAKKEGGVYRAEYRVLWADKSVHWIRVHGRVCLKARQFLGVVMEVTERQLESVFVRTQTELEKKLREKTDDLVKAARALKAEAEQRKEAENSREELFRLLVTSEEAERRRISREMHDHMGQYMTALGLELNALRQYCGTSPEAEERIDRLQNLTKNVGVEVHRIAMALRPTSLDDFGLHRSLLNCLQDFGEATGVAVDHHISGVEGAVLPDELQTTVYRFLQEALNNVMKHSSASRVSFILDVKPDYILGIVEDNGKGFSIEKHFRYSHLQRRLGLRGMKERIMLLGGEFQMESVPGQGTTVFVRIPVPHGALQEREHE